MSAKIRAGDIRKEYEEFDKDKLLDEVVDKVLEIEKQQRTKALSQLTTHCSSCFTIEYFGERVMNQL